MNGPDAYLREVIQYVPLRLLREHHIRAHRQCGARHERQRCAGMRDLREPVERGRAQAPIDQQAVVVAHEGEGHDADGGEDVFAYDGRRGEWGEWWASEVGGNPGGLKEDGKDDDEHADEGEAGGSGELVDVPVQGEREGDGERAQRNDELSVGEQRQYGYC
jgi:hypothetical protein